LRDQEQAMPLTIRFTLPLVRSHLAVAALWLLAGVPLPGCGDSQVASRGQANVTRDAAGGRGGQAGRGGTDGGSAGSGGSAGYPGPTELPGGDAGQATDAGLPDPDGPVTPEDDGGVPPDPIPPDAAPPPPVCVVDKPCDVTSGGQGLCRNDSCVACNGTADDAACTRAYGPSTICMLGRCVTMNCGTSANCSPGQLCNTSTRICEACTMSAQCKADPVYTAGSVCLGGRCIRGDCRDSSDCAAGKICGVATANLCGNCAQSSQCAADPRYRDHVCVNNSCTPGDCLTSTQCNAAKEGFICGVATRNRCGACTTDAQCAMDAKYRQTNRTTCFVGQGADRGKCVSNACQTVNQRCPQNPAAICCAAGNARACVVGDCCDNAQCGNGQVCVANKCTAAGEGCDGPANNQIIVDPRLGLDSSTGSGRAGGANRADCAFRTLTRALAAAGTGAINRGTIVLRGAGATTELRTVGGSAADPAESLPITITIPVRITTEGGAILLRLTRPGVPGFRLQAPVAIEPSAAAELTIDGVGQSGGAGIEVVNAGASEIRLQNLTVQNTGDHALKVDSAASTVRIGANVVASNAGTVAAPRSGLFISDGNVIMELAGNQAPTSFSGNTGAGIAVVGTGGLDVTGNPGNNARNGQGTVAVTGNRGGGLFIGQQPNAKAVRLTGVVVFDHPQSAGIQVVSGSNLRLRSSVVLNNGTGVLLAAAGQNQVFDRVDLGTETEPGQNVLQDRGPGATPNRNGGICFGDPVNQEPQVVNAQGNRFSPQVNCAAQAGTLVFSDSCTMAIDVQLHPALQVNTAQCPGPPAPPVDPPVVPPAMGAPAGR
jgi:hypothetical protein